MRTCTYCGAQFSDTELICPSCGQEIQLVPDYVTIESHMQEDQLKKIEKQRALDEEMEREEAYRRRRKQITRNILLLVLIAGLLLFGMIMTAVVGTANKRNNSFSYQYEMAEESYNNGRYEEAEEYITQALTLESGSREARLLSARISIARKSNKKAMKTLVSLAREYPEDAEIVGLLIPFYVEGKDVSAIQKLLRACDDEGLLKKYEIYLPAAPVITPDGGKFSSKTKVSISAKAGTIHYTVDGSIPNEKSPVYAEAFELGNGDTVVKAVTVTEVGAVSDVASSDFSVVLTAPPTPSITPKSGRYIELVDSNGDAAPLYLVEQYTLLNPRDRSEQGVTEITVVVPNGYTCRYSFDRKPDKTSPIYNGPVKMRQGEHVFYAVLESEDGRLGSVASATFVFSKVTVTPLPTPTPTPTPSETPTPSPTESSSSEEPSVTPEATEEPTPTEEPTEEPAPTEIPEEPSQNTEESPETE